jgi:ABC-type multidrug transport system fused ATPase/permease subunit
MQPTLPPQEDNLSMYLGVYVALSIIACIAGSVRYYFVLLASVRASRNLFNGLIHAVLRAPLRWLDTVPLGRILNRFTADFHSLDSRIGYDIGFFAGKILEVLGIMIAGMLVSPVVIVFAIILLMICLKLSLTYLAGARQIKRLESTAKSPVFEQFGSSLAGLITIRSFSKPDTYIELMYSKINRHAQAWWNLWLFNRWLGFRMNVVGAIFSTLTAALIVYVPGITASLAGFALSFALQYNSAIAMALRQYANLELNMNATERVIEYSNIEIENQGGLDAPAAWPTEGRLEVNDLVVGYAPDLPPVLNGLSFSVEKNQRVGVVGRTGAGKSSLTLALFRFLEARSGEIIIDGLDVSKIKLHDLRSRLAIIPQDPVLFSGTVRSNLDPFGEYSDTELYDALARVHLISEADDDELTLTSRTATPRAPNGSETGTTTPEASQMPTPKQKTNANAFTSLSATISEGGLNLSQGQRQLLCLARAIVSRPKIMVLDEATSAVDMETDALIQTSIRAEFGRNATTLLVIAHRLSTIADFDRILVMDAGKAAEFGTPKDLMGIEGGVFRNLVENSGEKEVLEKMIFE